MNCIMFNLYLCCYRNDGILELESVVTLWAKKLTSATKNGQYNEEDVKYVITWNKVKIRHRRPQFSDAKDPQSPKSQVGAIAFF